MRFFNENVRQWMDTNDIIRPGGIIRFYHAPLWFWAE